MSEAVLYENDSLQEQFHVKLLGNLVLAFISVFHGWPVTRLADHPRNAVGIVFDKIPKIHGYVFNRPLRRALFDFLALVNFMLFRAKYFQSNRKLKG